jgi:hypothetical protein
VDIAMGIVDISTDITDIGTDIADIVNIADIADCMFVNVVVETGRYVQGVTGVSYNINIVVKTGRRV